MNNNTILHAYLTGFVGTAYAIAWCCLCCVILCNMPGSSASWYCIQPHANTTSARLLSGIRTQTCTWGVHLEHSHPVSIHSLRSPVTPLYSVTTQLQMHISAAGMLPIIKIRHSVDGNMVCCCTHTPISEVNTCEIYVLISVRDSVRMCMRSSTCFRTLSVYCWMLILHAHAWVYCSTTLTVNFPWHLH